MSKYQRIFLIVIALAVGSGIVAALKPLRYGLDIAGGIRLVMQIDPKRQEEWPDNPDQRKTIMESTQKKIRERVKGLGGVAEPKVTLENVTTDRPRIIVELPGVRDMDQAMRMISSTASLEFYYLNKVQNTNNPMGEWQMEPAGKEQGRERYVFRGPNNETIDSIKQPNEVLEKVVGVKVLKKGGIDSRANPPIVTGATLLSNSFVGLDGTQVVVHIEFNQVGTAAFGKFTTDHVGDYLSIFFDNKLISAPVVQSAIPDGKGIITGGFTADTAKEMAELLNAGALPIPMKIIARESVEPTLGSETVRQAVLAGIVGLLLVVIFMAIYYRLPGLIADLALALYALFVIAVFKLMGATMSLAGLSALIISIGMAVDANILIFERLKEELKSGKTLRAAIDAGFGRAFTAIFDSNMCTAITCAILMWYGTPAVQSFALTLLIGVGISMFTAITVTRTILHLLVGWEWAQNPNLFGLNTGWLKSHLDWNIVGKRAYFFLLSAVLIVPGVIFLFTNRAATGSFLKLGIEFKSGTAIQAEFDRPATVSGVLAVVDKYAPGSEVELAKKGSVAFIKTTLESEKNQKAFEDKVAKIQTGLNETFGLKTRNVKGEPVLASLSSVGPTISKELTTNAFTAVILASIAIVLYLTMRFAIGGDLKQGLKYGVCAVIALIHDASFILGLFAILGKVLGWEVNALFVTAVLTIIGFSVHDTIVVFDRIRENLRHRLRGESFEDLCNRSILQTLSRSINTSFTVVMTLAMLVIFGGPLLRHFYIALLVGIMIGTYSSIFNATPLVVVWEKLFESSGPKKKAFEDKPLVSRPLVTPAPTPTRTGDGSQSVEATSADEAAAPADSAAKAARIKKKTTKKKRF